jgi:hypothetical protein
MSDFKIPELPSDDELGITKKDLKDLEELGGDTEPELSAKEMAALLGESSRPPTPAPKALGKAPPPKEPPKKKAAPRPEEPAGPRSRWRGPAMLGVLLVTSWLASSYRALPSPRPANAPDTVFSSARAMANLVEIGRRPHPPGSPAHAQVRGYLLERLRDLGLEPEVQATTSMSGREAYVRAATVRNIVARIPGTASTGTIVLTAHYDGREISAAAADDGAGVVAILEAARALGAGAPLRNDVLLLITDGEELGLLGARAFVEQHPAMGDVKVVISLEMRGGGGPSVMFETGADNGWIVQALKASGARPYANSMSYEVYKSLPNDALPSEVRHPAEPLGGDATAPRGQRLERGALPRRGAPRRGERTGRHLHHLAGARVGGLRRGPRAPPGCGRVRPRAPGPASGAPRG